MIRETTAFNRVLAALEAAAEYRIDFVAKREDVAKFVREVKRLKKKGKR